MVVSMTGYGHSNVAENNVAITTEIKTVNHRYCEINVRLPKELSSIEDQIKRRVLKSIRRGKADVYITVELSSVHNEKLVINWPLLDQYYNAFQQIEQRYTIENRLQVKDFLQIPELFEIQQNTTGLELVSDVIFQSLDQAVDTLRLMRKTEGAALEKALLLHLEQISQLLDTIEQLAPETISAYQNKLIQLINEAGGSDLDDQRILTEVALYADRSNIHEEVIRLKSHLEQFQEILKETGTIGRKLDFLLQEMNREINTIGSKSSHIEISKAVVSIKSEIEKLREQVQNIE